MDTSEEPKPPPAPPPQSDGKVLGWLNAVKGLTFTNALVIIMLVVVAIPTYLIYRAVNDEKLLDRFLADYREIASPHTNCLLRKVQLRGGPETWWIGTGFAYQGADRWQIGVILPREPTENDQRSYCATLNLLVDFMRDPAARSPPFPGTSEPVVRQYEREQP